MRAQRCQMDLQKFDSIVINLEIDGREMDATRKKNEISALVRVRHSHSGITSPLFSCRIDWIFRRISYQPLHPIKVEIRRTCKLEGNNRCERHFFFRLIRRVNS